MFYVGSNRKSVGGRGSGKSALVNHKLSQRDNENQVQTEQEHK